MANAEYVFEKASIRARQLCASAQDNGYSVIQEGSLWLSTRKYLEEDGNLYQRSDYSEAMYWVEMCEAEPMPIQGPDDPVLLEILMHDS